MTPRYLTIRRIRLPSCWKFHRSLVWRWQDVFGDTDESFNFYLEIP